MRVCVSTTTFPRWSGDGQGAFIWEAVRALAKRGVTIRVVSMHSPKCRTREYIDGIEVVRPRYWWPERWEILRSEGPGGLPATLKRRPYAYLQLVSFALVHTAMTARLARGCDIVHAHWTLSAAAASVGQSIHGKPIVATVHGTDIYQGTSGRVGALVARMALWRCRRIVAVSRDLMEHTIRIGVDQSKLVVLSNGVDTERFVPANGSRDNIVLFVGSLIKRKGVDHLIEALPAVIREQPDYRLVLVGDGPERGVLHDKASKLKVEEHIRFVGEQSQDDVRTWMQRARVLVLPSVEEAQGVVLLEALACGTPIVASKVGGIPEVVTPDVGTLVPAADERALSEAIIETVADDRHWADRSRRARERAVEYYSWDSVVERTLALYQSVLDDA